VFIKKASAKNYKWVKRSEATGLKKQGKLKEASAVARIDLGGQKKEWEAGYQRLVHTNEKGKKIHLKKEEWN